MRVAVIGVGAMGKNHARVYHEMPEVELVAVADGNRALAENVGQLHGARLYDYRAMLE